MRIPVDFLKHIKEHPNCKDWTFVSYGGNICYAKRVKLKKTGREIIDFEYLLDEDWDGMRKEIKTIYGTDIEKDCPEEGLCFMTVGSALDE